MPDIFEFTKIGFWEYEANPGYAKDGEYVSLAEYQQLEALLKRWEKLGLRLCQIAESAGLQGIPKLIQLIQDTKEVLK